MERDQFASIVVVGHPCGAFLFRSLSVFLALTLTLCVCVSLSVCLSLSLCGMGIFYFFWRRACDVVFLLRVVCQSTTYAVKINGFMGWEQDFRPYPKSMLRP